ncbi:LysR substrate-binding domain-containing protein [Curvibacter sp. RS43]|uniref:LysR substrate-binding domain-containing protein n=1 Tax=Curvibacter microcysteis TaxID=3026419 RepID=UPI00235FACD5|nr:LysR substrate-binding domain-containing protein [Curvibacter sp. RS43]MDD0812907.1 LysR substrate-binding domain-containing protein [Curvibacter sp. RS43]
MKRQLPPLNALRAFEAAARLGRMSAAALELSVTPGAISRQVQQLERSLNVKLFEGSKNKPLLTPAAQTLLSALSPALDQMEAAVKAISNANSGVLDVACFSTFMVKWLIPRLFDFNALHSDIEIRLQTTQRADDPDQERMDLVIAVQELASSMPNAVPLFPEHLGPVLAPALADRLALKTPLDLPGKTLLQSKGRLDAWAMWASAMGCATPLGPGATFDHYYFALEGAVSGLGIALAPWHLVADDILAGRLVAPFGFCSSGLHYVAKCRQQRNLRLDLFCDWLQAQAAQFTLAPAPLRAMPSSP